MRANQVRLYLSTVAYVVLRAVREFGLKGTEMAQAQCDTIWNRLLKIGAVIQVSVRRVLVSLSKAYAFRGLFQRVWENLRNVAAPEVPGAPGAPASIVSASG